MQKAGDYTDRCQWLKRTTTKDSTGQDVATYTAAPRPLFCAFETFTGRVQDEYGAEQQGQSATIRIRNYPSVSALDRLYRPEWDQTWIIDSLSYGDNEIICDAHAYEALEL